MSKQPNGNDSDYRVGRETSSDTVAMDVSIHDRIANRDNEPTETMRIEVSRDEVNDPSAIEAAVAQGLRSRRSQRFEGADSNDGSFHQPRLATDRRMPVTRSPGGGMGDHPSDGPDFVPDEEPSIVGRELSLRDIFFMVRERWILGLSVGLLLAGGLAYWMMSKPPVFESSAEIIVQLKVQKIIPMESLEEESSTRSTLEQVMQVHAKSLESLPYRQYVEESLSQNGGNSRETNRALLVGFRTFDAFKKAYTDGLLRQRLRGRKPTSENLEQIPGADELFDQHFYKSEDPPLKVFSGKRSQFVGISFRHPDANVARQVAHAFAELYDPFLDQKEKNTYASANAFLRGEVEKLHETIVAEERKIVRYRQKYKIVESVEGEGSRATGKVETLDSEMVASQLELNEMELQLAQIERVDSSDVVTVSRLPGVSDYGLVPTIRENLDVNREERAQLELRYLERHPKILANSAQRASLVKQLQEHVALAVDDFKARVIQKRQQQEELKGELAVAEDASLGDNDPFVDYRVMVGNLEILKENHRNMLDRLNETEMAQRMDRTKIDVTTPALLPSEPVDPDPKKVLALSGLLLLAGLFGLPVGLGFLDTRLKSFSEAEAFLGIECLGCVAERPKLSHMELGQCVLAERDGQITEGFRVIYSSAELHSGVGFPKIFVTTSTGPGEGKSFVTANLGATFARHGRRVLIIDCDLRKPSQHKLIGVKNDAGLLKWFNEGRSVPTTAKELVDDHSLGFVPLSEEFDIFLLRAGGSTRNPSEIISSSTFEELLVGLRNWFDVILLDSPPVGLFPDALFLANYAEEAIFVCKHNGLNRHKIKFALKKMQSGRAEVSGTVMNQFSASRRHQYGYGYKDYGYGSYSYREYAEYYSDDDN